MEIRFSARLHRKRRATWESREFRGSRAAGLHALPTCGTRSSQKRDSDGQTQPRLAPARAAPVLQSERTAVRLGDLA